MRAVWWVLPRSPLSAVVGQNKRRASAAGTAQRVILEADMDPRCFLCAHLTIQTNPIFHFLFLPLPGLSVVYSFANCARASIMPCFSDYSSLYEAFENHVKEFTAAERLWCIWRDKGSWSSGFLRKSIKYLLFISLSQWWGNCMAKHWVTTITCH